jgi:c-di-GMP-binding flagellar brake protein YcgR
MKAPPDFESEATLLVERRRAVRVDADEAGHMRVLNPVSLERLKVQVLDVSLGGFKLRAPQFLQRGTTVQILFRKAISQGDVRYCVPTPDGFHLGVQIQEAFPVPQLTK